MSRAMEPTVLRKVARDPRTWIPVGLLGLTVAVYAQVAGHPFVMLDDDVMITGNPEVLQGLTWRGLSWAFTSTSGPSFWHPLTWLSHMIDVELFGLDAGRHHLMSVALHAVGAMLLFLVLRRMTGAVWRSGFVAALFAVHPLHVESVAWASERKDTLSGLLFMITLLAYARYVERPGARRYLAVALSFGMALMSKPMVVTLPFLLLLLDYWPLGRVGGAPPAADAAAGPIPRASPARILWEKVPLLAMAAASAAVTTSYTGSGAWIVALDDVPIAARAANAAVSCATYLWKAVWPGSLAVLYPHPSIAGLGVPTWKICGSVLLLGAGFLVSLREAGRRPYLGVGWLWFLGTLVPVVGLVQAGGQAMADRYTYIPLVGVFIAAAWGAPAALAPGRFRPLILGALGGAVLAALSTVAWHQAGYWRSSVTLLSRTLAVTENNWLVWNNLGVAYLKLDRPGDAIACFREAVRVNPGYPIAWFNLGSAYRSLNMVGQAIGYTREGLRLKPDFTGAWHSLAGYYSELGRIDDAAACYREILRIDPGDAAARRGLDAAGGKTGPAR